MQTQLNTIFKKIMVYFLELFFASLFGLSHAKTVTNLYFERNSIHNVNNSVEIFDGLSKEMGMHFFISHVFKCLSLLILFVFPSRFSLHGIKLH